MNGTQQVARATAVNRAERRLDDMELVINAFATAMVEDRKATASGASDTLTVIGKLGEMVTDVRTDLIALNLKLANELLPRENTLWGRLRWLVTGR